MVISGCLLAWPLGLVWSGGLAVWPVGSLGLYGLVCWADITRVQR